jgi:hypothetical protein
MFIEGIESFPCFCEIIHSFVGICIFGFFVLFRAKYTPRPLTGMYREKILFLDSMDKNAWGFLYLGVINVEKNAVNAL